ncbi:uncharacterized protein [Elaeis guineensis]|uniref:Uncharacterized protein LOC105049700 n=1 Tax=Elaeis guineensis var. tenera TaxID=51953 RepID=A0A6I9RSN6_ELAGV|nr:uncharacterized protein LOC105049700 [Elaeis guineensis]
MSRLPLPMAKRYVLRLFISLKYATANVVDRQSGRVVVTASSVEKALKEGLECGHTCNDKAAAAVGEVLVVRFKVDGLAQEPIYANAAKEVEKKGFKNRSKVWAIFNALRSHSVNLHLDQDDHEPPASLCWRFLDILALSNNVGCEQGDGNHVLQLIMLRLPIIIEVEKCSTPT